MIAEAVVHATGINWVGISPIIGSVIAAVAVIITLQTRRENRSEKRNNEIKDEIATSVNNLGELLSARMETKETVARISERLARVEGAMGVDRNKKPGT